jgi:acyl-CoA dehydrogenase
LRSCLLASEGAELGSRGGDARRLLLARLVLDHRLGSTDPFALPDDAWENAVSGKLLSDDPVPLPEATTLLAA